MDFFRRLLDKLSGEGAGWSPYEAPPGERATMTPQLSALKADAEALEIPWEIQKGLLFVIAFDLSLVPANADADELMRQRVSLSRHLPDVPERFGENFYPRVVEEILPEITLKMIPDYRPRMIQTPSGASLPSFTSPKTQRLPPFDPKRLTLARSSEVAKSLHRQIGECIEEDLEGAYLAGLLFVDANGRVDRTATWQMGCAASSVQPPHMQWLRYSLYSTPELIQSGNPIQKVLSCLLRGSDAFKDLLVLFADRLHYSGPGEKRREMWEATLDRFRFQAVEEARSFIRLPFNNGALDSIRSLLLTEGWEASPRGLSLEAAVRMLDQDVRETWGYDLLASEQALYSGERLDRRCCVMHSALRGAILAPL